MWFCDKCGKENGEQAAFCDGCGAPRPAEAGRASAGKSRKTPFLIAGIVLGLALIGLGLWLLLGRGAAAPLSRVTYMKTTTNPAGSGIVTETRYSYSGNTGRASYNGGYELLHLDDRGLIASADRYDTDGILRGRIEYEYDARGNQTRQRVYDEYGQLTQEWYTEFHQGARVADYQEIIRYDSDMQVRERRVFQMTDQTHARQDVYQYGTLTETSTTVRSYEGDRLLRQQTFDSKGNFLMESTWEFDEYGYILSIRTEYPDGRTQTVEYRYERIG